MAKKPTVTTIASGYASTTTLNNNFEALREGFDNTLSLDGSTPNAMQADLDMDGNDILDAGSIIVGGQDLLAATQANLSAAAVAQALAEAAVTAAETSETNAATSATSASTSASNAATSASQAASSALSASGSATASATSALAAESAETNAETAETNAAASAASALASETAAAASEAGVDADRVAAQAAAASAAASETAAATSETNAATSADEAETFRDSSALNAATSSASATNAQIAASAANTSALNAALSEDGAAASETNAAFSAANAAGNSLEASNFATAAASSASASATSATDSEAARDQSQDARDTANLHKLAAEAAATSATNTAAALTGFDLEAIAESKAVTAVDVFVYDTSKDSDGGAWRKRTQGTSWYNETLNTATRGSRREFPAVAVIVAENNKVTIYDGDDPDLPMWRVTNQTTAPGGTSVNFWRPTRDAGSVTAQEGVVLVGLTDTASTSGLGLLQWDFIADTISRRNTSSVIKSSAVTDDQKNVDLASFLGGGIVSETVNDVAMTVLPNAPIDAATGLPVPTIAVATDGGVSVIRDDGTVVDWTPTGDGTVENIHIDADGIVTSTGGGVAWKFFFLDQIPASDSSAAPSFTFNQTSTPARMGFDSNAGEAEVVKTNNVFALPSSEGSGQKGLNLLSINRDMVAYTTTTYNTGWMNGDIKGAFLSDTDDTDLVGSGEIWSGTPDRIDANWTDNLDGTYTSDGSTGFIGFVSPAPLIANETYVCEITVDSITSGSVTLPYDGTGLVPKTSVGTFVGTFVADAGGATNGVYVYGNTFAGTVSNISVKLADADRSVNANGLIVNGTVTRSPVATGADLVACSGFSASNYLEQPYNSDLDFGTGDFCVMGWVNLTSTGTQVFIDRSDGSTGRIALFLINGVLYFSCAAGTGSPSTGYTFSSGRHFLVMKRLSGVLSVHVDGVQVYSVGNTANVSGSGSKLFIGVSHTLTAPTLGSLALWRISATAPTASQIAKIYRDEAPLFQENAQATLYGSSDAVTALAHDPELNLLHVGTSAGRSVFQGLRRVENTTTAVGTAISASNGLVVEE